MSKIQFHETLARPTDENFSFLLESSRFFFRELNKKDFDFLIEKIPDEQFTLFQNFFYKNVPFIFKFPGFSKVSKAIPRAQISIKMFEAFKYDLDRKGEPYLLAYLLTYLIHNYKNSKLYPEELREEIFEKFSTNISDGDYVHTITKRCNDKQLNQLLKKYPKEMS